MRALRSHELGDASAAASLHALLDLDDDERPDFVRTYDSSGDAGDGVWLVHRNTGDGFAETPIRWTVPGRAYHHTAQGDAAAASRLYVTLPRLRRGPPDFLVTYRLDDPDHATWLAHENTGTGFADPPITWQMPLRAVRTAAQGDASAASALFATTDLDGDRTLDLVVSYAPASSVGAQEWTLHRGCVAP